MPTSSSLTNPINRRLRALVTLTLPLAPVVLAGCGDGGSAAEFVVRDSAGVRIVENVGPAWGAGEGWRVSAEPTLEIGAMDGAEEYLFANIPSARRLGDGRIVVGATQSPWGMIRFYGPDGAFLNAAAPQGDGPGEVGQVFGFLPHAGDSVATWDRTSNRLTVFDGEGGVERMLRVELPSEQTIPGSGGTGVFVMQQGVIRGIFSDGSFIASPSSTNMVEFGTVASSGSTFLRYSAEGVLTDTIGHFALGEVLMSDPRTGGPSPRLPYARNAVFAYTHDRMVHGIGEFFEIRILAPDGAVEQIIRSTHRDLTLTEAAREAFREAERERVRDAANFDAAAFDRALRDLPYPEALPPYSQIVVDALGNLWTLDVRIPGVEGPNRWNVFDPDGILLGIVETPDGVRVHQVGEDFVLGVRTDELGVPYVVMYGLERR